jgi:hypothetical protein
MSDFYSTVLNAVFTEIFNDATLASYIPVNNRYKTTGEASVKKRKRNAVGNLPRIEFIPEERGDYIPTSSSYIYTWTINCKVMTSNLNQGSDIKRSNRGHNVIKSAFEQAAQKAFALILSNYTWSIDLTAGAFTDVYNDEADETMIIGYTSEIPLTVSFSINRTTNELS